MAHFFSSRYRARRNDHGPDPFPVHRLKRVDKPTTLIYPQQVQRVDEREGGFRRGARGDFGAFIQRESNRFIKKHPLSDALLKMTMAMQPLVAGNERSTRLPLEEDPI